MRKVNYEKYAAMDRKALFNALEKEERKLDGLEQKLKDKFKEQKELVKFLRQELAKKIARTKEISTRKPRAKKQ